MAHLKSLSAGLLPGLLAASAIVLATPAAAAVTSYASQAAFDAAASGVTTFGFDEGNSDAHFHVIDNPSTFGGFTFENLATPNDTEPGDGPILFLVGAAATPTYGTDFLAFQNNKTGLAGKITHAGVTAFGFSFGSYLPVGDATLTLSTGDSFTITPGDVAQFIGFVSDAPITSISFDYADSYTFDILSVSSGAAAVPEPAAWALMIGGFGLAGATLRRRRRLA